jgi:hypothetical protein
MAHSDDNGGEVAQLRAENLRLKQELDEQKHDELFKDAVSAIFKKNQTIRDLKASSADLKSRLDTAIKSAQLKDAHLRAQVAKFELEEELCHFRLMYADSDPMGFCWQELAKERLAHAKTNQAWVDHTIKQHLIHEDLKSSFADLKTRYADRKSRFNTAIKDVKLKEPLVEVAISVRQQDLEQEKENLGSGFADRRILDAGNRAAHYPNIAADRALRFLKQKSREAQAEEADTRVSTALNHESDYSIYSRFESCWMDVNTHMEPKLARLFNVMAMMESFSSRDELKDRIEADRAYFLDREGEFLRIYNAIVLQPQSTTAEIAIAVEENNDLEHYLTCMEGNVDSMRQQLRREQRKNCQ